MNDKVVRREIPVMLFATLVVIILAWDGSISQFEGLGLLIMFVGYTVATIRKGGLLAPDANSEAVQPNPRRGLFVQIALVVVGLGLLVLGARWLLDGVTAIAKGLGVSEIIVSLTIVAAGTSLPELATSIMASIRGERDADSQTQ